MSAPMDPDCRAGKHRACMGAALDEVSDTVVPCGCSCHGEHDHEWEGRAGGSNATCRLCGARRVVGAS